MGPRIVKKYGPKSLSTAANLAKLLPTGTVLAFEALVPSFSNYGKCLDANKYLTFGIIVIFSAVCFLSSFTDSFTCNHGKLYYGIATINGLFIFNKDDDCEDHDDNDDDIEDKDKVVGNEMEEANDQENKKEGLKAKDCIVEMNLKGYRIRPRDFVHAFSSLMVFLVFATSNFDVQSCFFPHSGDNGNQLMMNLPLGVGALATLLFTIFPTKRRGIAHADSSAPRGCTKRTYGSRTT